MVWNGSTPLFAAKRRRKNKKVDGRRRRKKKKKDSGVEGGDAINLRQKARSPNKRVKKINRP